MVDVAERCLGEEAHSLRLNSQDFLPFERFDRDIIARDLPVWRFVGSKREEIISHFMCLSEVAIFRFGVSEAAGQCNLLGAGSADTSAVERPISGVERCHKTVNVQPLELRCRESRNGRLRIAGFRNDYAGLLDQDRKFGGTMGYSLSQRLAAEALGTGLLLATVVGSGIMAEALAGGNVALALLGNTIPTGAILVVLITMLGPISGAHFNPAVSFVFALKRDLSPWEAGLYTLVQIAGGVLGVWAAHVMFDLDLWQISTKMRASSGQWFSEFIAAFGLIATILLTLKAREGAVAMAVGLYITAAYWFTASTSFANPAVTIARALSDTFAGILPADVPAFILAQMLGAAVALGVCNWLLKQPKLP